MNYSQMTVDHEILAKLPQEVINAVRVLEEHFGHTDWALGGVCSRLMYERTKTRLELEQARVAFCAPWA